MYPHTTRGMTFMDVIVGTALMLIIFTALVGLLRSSLQVASLAKTRSIATTIAESQMEFIRSLSYEQVGTVGGIPAGTIPQVSTTTENGLDFPVRTFIEYVDDPSDGLNTADTNSITTDYKRIKVSVTYFSNNRSQEVNIISNYAPPSIETTTGGGTLKINVVNAAGTGVAGASVRIVNASTSPSIDLTTFSDSVGIVQLPGAPTSTQYQLYVSKNGYSSAQTYTRDTTNQNPTPGYLTVVKNQTTTVTFAIDLLSTLKIYTFTPVATSTFADTFTSSANVQTVSNATVTGGSIQLSADANGYAYSGSARSALQSPTFLSKWGMAIATTSLPAGTSVRMHIVDSGGTLLPDSALPGNSAGFTSTIDLSTLSTTTYPSLGLSADLVTSSTTTTPYLQDWSLSYARGPIPLGNITTSLIGAKTIGSTGAGVPIYKTSISTSTNASGVLTQPTEWDVYSLTLPSTYDTVSACTPPPYTIPPGSTVSSSLMLSTSTPNMILVSARDSSGTSVPSALVTLTNGGYSKTVTTDTCGSAYFGSLSSGSYSISAAKTGYTTFNASAVSISGHLFYTATLE